MNVSLPFVAIALSLSIAFLGNKRQNQQRETISHDTRIISIDSITIIWLSPIARNNDPIPSEYRSIEIQTGRPLVIDFDIRLSALFAVDTTGDAVADTTFWAPYRFQKVGQIYQLPSAHKYAVRKGGLFLAKKRVFSIMEAS